MIKIGTIPYALFKSFSFLVFSDSLIVGAILFAVSFVNPSAGIHALFGFMSAILFGKIIGISKDNLLSGLQLYNSILVGLAIGYLFDVSIISMAFVSIAAIFTLLLSNSMHVIFGGLFNLPILNLPFAIIATIIYLASVRYGSLHMVTLSSLSVLNISILPIWLSGLLKSLGTLLFLPYDLVGIVLLLMFFVTSRINFFLVIIGYYSGTIFHGLLSGSFVYAFQDTFGFNFILISLALGGYFLIPSKRSYIIAIVGTAISAIVLDAVTAFWSSFQIPVFTLPFVLTVLLILHTLKINRFKYITLNFLKTPEQNLELWYNYKERFNATLPAPRLPFSGEWTVYQGFDDTWTHQGLWRYAVDFIIEDVNAVSYRNEGLALEDYYCFNKPVLSPVAGEVVSVQNDLLDNPIGTVDKENNWGNFIIIYSDFGYFVELSHLVKDSIKLSVGDRVVAGEIVGRCGNSGYSPQPHLHMQCQPFNYIGSEAMLFTLSQTLCNNRLIKQEFRPEKGSKLRPMTISKKINNRLIFILDDHIEYSYTVNGVEREVLTLVVKMEIDGTYYFEDIKRGSRLYFIHNSDEFMFTAFYGNKETPLRFLATALPSLPLSEDLIIWNDVVINSLATNQNLFSGFIKSLHHALYSSVGEYKISPTGDIIGSVISKNILSSKKITSKVALDNYKGFRTISVTDRDVFHELHLKS